MILSDDAKKNAATIVVGISGMEKGKDEVGEMKKEASQAILEAIEEKKVDDLMEALSAFFMLCEESEDY